MIANPSYQCADMRPNATMTTNPLYQSADMRPDQDPASFGLVNLAYDQQAAPTPDTASGD